MPEMAKVMDGMVCSRVQSTTARLGEATGEVAGMRSRLPETLWHKKQSEAGGACGDARRPVAAWRKAMRHVAEIC